MKANYHTHTYRCHHAYHCEWEYVEAAIAAGISVLGFSDHAPMPFSNGYRSHIRMTPEQLPDYIGTVARLKARYRDQIEIRCGLEAEYYPEVFPAFLRMLDACPGVEYLILGQHYLGNEYDTEWEHTAKPGTEYLLGKYVDQVIEGMATGKFLYLCHPDVANLPGHEAAYDRHMTRLCRAAKAFGLPLELNGQGLRGRRHYPSDRFFSIAGREGCVGVIGLDAHQAPYMNRPEEVAALTAMAERNGISLAESLPIEKRRAWK